MRLRSIEGQPGTLQIYVTSQVLRTYHFEFRTQCVVTLLTTVITQVQPKRCRKILVPIYALSLHIRQHDDDETQSSGPFNELKLSGNFTIAEVRFFILLMLLP